ncbi:MAG: DUF1573 domain-containing protein [Bacteroidota bacterium]|nr:DUF1573 domain-containing protein [Bacteroidota bacterium]
MKKILFAVLALTSTSLFAQKKADDIAKLDVQTYDLGKVKQGVPATATFVVTNISSEPLLIEQANPTCGCTVSDYTKSEIAPGKTGYIKATYNAANAGHIDKTLTVKFAGVDDIKSIKLTGDVLDATAYDKAVANGEIKKADAATTKKEKKEKKAMATSSKS